MYSDSESESDYNPEYDDTGRVINYQSNSSVSDSDEEFMCSLTTRKKTTGAQRGPKPRGGGGVGPGRPRRGRGARTHVESSNSGGSRDVPMLVKPPEDMSYGSLLEPGIHPPPILIKHQPQDLNTITAATAATTTNATAVGEEMRSSELRVAHLPSVPALVKAPERMGSESNEIEEFDRLTSIGLPSQQQQQQQQQHPPHHIQPPPSLVMPSPSSISTPSVVPISSSLSVLPSVGSHQRRREPPPLVRNTTDKPPPQMTTSNSTIELQDSTPHSSHPQIICLSPGEQQQQQQQLPQHHQRRTPQQAGIPQQSSLSYSIVTQAPQPSYSIVTQQTPSQQSGRNSQLSTVSVDGGGRGRGGGGQQPPHKPRRPGRPRKDQSVTLSTGLRTSAKTVRLGGGGGGGAEGGGAGGGGRGRGGSTARAHYRSGRGGGRVGQNSSQSTKKGMKMTQYEFENVTSSPFPPSLVGTGAIPQALQQQQQQVQQQVAQQQQPQLFQLGSGTAGVAQNLQSLVTPLQIIPAASIPGYHGISGGGMLLLQNTPQGVTLAAPPSGNDVVAPTTLLGGNTYQLVQAAPMIATDQGENAQKVSVIMHPTAGVGTPVQYIAQFDGPPPKGKSSKAPQSRKDLHKKFEKERKKEQAKLEQNAMAVISTRSNKSKSKCSKTTDSDTAVAASGSSSKSAENLMSSELEKYLKIEKTRKKRKPSTSTAAAGSSDSGSSLKTKVSTAAATRRKKQSHPSTRSPPKNIKETTETEEEEEEIAGVPEREEDGGEPSVAKKTRTKGKKKSLLGKRKSRAKEETEEEDDNSEQQLPPNEEGDPPTSSPPEKTKPREQEEEGEGEERESELRTIQAGSEGASEVAMESESPLTSNRAAQRGRRGRRSKRVKLESSNQETEHERTIPASNEEILEATMETQASTVAATNSKRGSRRGKGRGSGTVRASTSNEATMETDDGLQTSTAATGSRRGSAANPQHTCDECGKEFVSHVRLLGHMEKMHSPKLTVSCGIS